MMNNESLLSRRTAPTICCRRLRLARGLTVRDVQRWFGFEEPQAICKWQRGESLPTVDNLYALGGLLEVPMDRILVQKQLYRYSEEQGFPAPFVFACRKSGKACLCRRMSAENTDLKLIQS